MRRCAELGAFDHTVPGCDLSCSRFNRLAIIVPHPIHPQTHRYGEFGAFWDTSAPKASDRALLLPFPGSSAYRIAAFVKVDVIEHGHDKFPLEAALLDTLRECRRRLVAETAFHNERIPQLAVL